MLDSKKQKIIMTNFKTREITNESITQIYKYPLLFRGSVKTSLGKIYTTKDFNKRVKSIQKMKLP